MTKQSGSTDYSKSTKESVTSSNSLLGTRVSEGHVNYVMAYDILTGIRVSVSRTNAKPDRMLTDADFNARNKLAFDISGNELTPSARYDFKFKDYAPLVFRHLRQMFHLDPADYLMSLTSKYIVSELDSPGKSGSFFYFSRDYRFIIKTIHHSEHKYLRKILKQYYEHVKAYPSTLISQIYGLHRVKLPFGRKVHFIVMNNLSPPNRDIHYVYDLKGSTLGRMYHEKRSSPAVLKDLNWLQENMHISLGPQKREMFMKQLKADVALLERLNIMDYSLFIGIHDMKRGNQENIRDSMLKVFQPNTEDLNELSPIDTEQIRHRVSTTSPMGLEQTSSKLPLSNYPEKKYFAFYSEDGGLRATDEHDRPLDEIYYMGVIDCLTNYSFSKRIETFAKGLTHNRKEISAIPAVEYGKRFLDFISSSIRTPEQL